MIRLSYIVDATTTTETIQHLVGDVFELRLFSVDSIQHLTLEPYLVFDISLDGGNNLLEMKEWLKRRPKGTKTVFVVDKTSRAEKVQAYALGATDIIHRPINGKALLTTLLGDFDSLALDTSHPPLRSLPVVGQAFDALENVFSSACLGAPIDLEKMGLAGEVLVDCIEAHGLGSWIGIVRKHHSLTYQHSLIVTGVAVAFGQKLGFSARDRQKLSFAGMLHDIGKAHIPVSILEKPGRLDRDEMEIIRKHPEYGYDALKSLPEIHEDMLDMVVHHHEYLDGSGYPHGLRAGEISDLVRIMTISDIFGALIERRSYREPMTGETAYKILLDMGPKLDRELVREFRFASGLKISPPSQTIASDEQYGHPTQQH
jgi:putative nucleotidyltransferase with HDIG domain